MTMELLRKLKPTVWEIFVHKYFQPATTVCQNTGDFTFQPSREFILDLTSSFTTAKIEKFENSDSFSSYHVDYFIGVDKGEAIYKTTRFIYPTFTMYDTVEEYRRSFFIND
jgi:hypothetical protein